MVNGCLIFIKNSGEDGSKFPVMEEKLTIGRSDKCDVQISNPQVSFEHCEILIPPEQQAKIRNLSFVNPTLLNGKLVKPGDSMLLSHGDLIKVGEKFARWEYLPTSSYYRHKLLHSIYKKSPNKQIAVVTPQRRTPQSSQTPSKKNPKEHLYSGVSISLEGILQPHTKLAKRQSLIDLPVVKSAKIPGRKSEPFKIQKGASAVKKSAKVGATKVVLGRKSLQATKLLFSAKSAKRKTVGQSPKIKRLSISKTPLKRQSGKLSRISDQDNSSGSSFRTPPLSIKSSDESFKTPGASAKKSGKKEKIQGVRHSGVKSATKKTPVRKSLEKLVKTTSKSSSKVPDLQTITESPLVSVKIGKQLKMKTPVKSPGSKSPGRPRKTPRPSVSPKSPQKKSFTPTKTPKIIVSKSATPGKTPKIIVTSPTPRKTPKRIVSKSPTPKKTPKITASKSPTPRKTPKIIESKSPTPRKTPKKIESKSPTPRKTPKIIESKSPTPRKTPKTIASKSPTPRKTPKVITSESPSPTKTPKIIASKSPKSAKISRTSLKKTPKSPRSVKKTSRSSHKIVKKTPKSVKKTPGALLNKSLKKSVSSIKKSVDRKSSIVEVPKITPVKTPKVKSTPIKRSPVSSPIKHSTSKKMPTKSPLKMKASPPVKGTKRKLSTGTLSVERAVKRIKVNDPKILDKNKKAALWVLSKAKKGKIVSQVYKTSQKIVKKAVKQKIKAPKIRSVKGKAVVIQRRGRASKILADIPITPASPVHVEVKSKKEVVSPTKSPVIRSPAKSTSKTPVKTSPHQSPKISSPRSAKGSGRSSLKQTPVKTPPASAKMSPKLGSSNSVKKSPGRPRKSTSPNARSPQKQSTPTLVSSSSSPRRKSLTSINLSAKKAPSKVLFETPTSTVKDSKAEIEELKITGDIHVSRSPPKETTRLSDLRAIQPFLPPPGFLFNRRSSKRISGKNNTGTPDYTELSPTVLGLAPRNAYEMPPKKRRSTSVTTPRIKTPGIIKSASTSKKARKTVSFLDLTDDHTPNTTLFDFDSIETPDISKEVFVSPLLSSRKGTPVVKLERSPKLFASASSTGARKLFTKRPADDLTGVRSLRNSPQKSSNNDCSVINLRSVFSPQKSPKNDLTNIKNLRKLFSPNKSPKNDLSDVRGVKQLLITPGQKSPKKEMSIGGLRTLFSPPKSPKNDLTNICGIRTLFQTPGKHPKNDLRDVSGVRDLFIRNRPGSSSDVTPNLADLFKSPKDMFSPVVNLNTKVDSPDFSAKRMKASQTPVKSPPISPAKKARLSLKDSFDPKQKKVSLKESVTPILVEAPGTPLILKKTRGRVATPFVKPAEKASRKRSVSSTESASPPKKNKSTTPSPEKTTRSKSTRTVAHTKVKRTTKKVVAKSSNKKTTRSTSTKKTSTSSDSKTTARSPSIKKASRSASIKKTSRSASIKKTSRSASIKKTSRSPSVKKTSRSASIKNNPSRTVSIPAPKSTLRTRKGKSASSPSPSPIKKSSPSPEKKTRGRKAVTPKKEVPAKKVASFKKSIKPVKTPSPPSVRKTRGRAANDSQLSVTAVSVKKAAPLSSKNPAKVVPKASSETKPSPAKPARATSKSSKSNIKKSPAAAARTTRSVKEKTASAVEKNQSKSVDQKKGRATRTAAASSKSPASATKKVQKKSPGLKIKNLKVKSSKINRKTEKLASKKKGSKR